MSGIPETEKDHNDFISMLADGARRLRTIKKDGVDTEEFVLDTKKIDYKTQLVNYPGFGRFVFHRERLAALADEVVLYMSEERAKPIKQLILSIYEAYGYSVDAKSSETLRDKNNSMSSLTHILTRNKVERAISIEEEAKKGFLSSLIGPSEKRKAVDS